MHTSVGLKMSNFEENPLAAIELLDERRTELSIIFSGFWCAVGLKRITHGSARGILIGSQDEKDLVSQKM
jgi:hypothetical protein